MFFRKRVGVEVVRIRVVFRVGFVGIFRIVWFKFLFFRGGNSGLVLGILLIL